MKTKVQNGLGLDAEMRMSDEANDRRRTHKIEYANITFWLRASLTQ